ncbi:MAG: hypothetical protein ACLFUO_06775 [Candidatus Woesearchaeota archaeon]
MDNIFCFVRYYIGNYSSFSEFKKIAARCRKAKKQKNMRITLLINIDKSIIKKKYPEFSNEIIKLTKEEISYSVTPALGAGHAFFDIIEESLSVSSIKGKTLFLIDGDQYDISSPDFLYDIKTLHRQVLKQGAIIGLAKRTKVNLASDNKLQTYREIEELYHALFIKNQFSDSTSKKIIKRLKIPSFYAEMGDCVPGCYCININHPNFFNYLNELHKNLIKVNLNKYSGDPFVVMSASRFGNIINHKVETLHNPPSGFDINTIVKKHKALSKTSIAKKYLKVIQSKKSFSLLEKYYGREDILFVKKLMLKGFR